MIWCNFHRSFIHKGPINQAALFRVIAWHLAGNKLLPEPMIIQYTDVYMCR